VIAVIHTLQDSHHSLVEIRGSFEIRIRACVQACRDAARSTRLQALKLNLVIPTGVGAPATAEGGICCFSPGTVPRRSPRAPFPRGCPISRAFFAREVGGPLL